MVHRIIKNGNLAMPYLSRKQRLVIAFGGFTLFVGFVILVLAILATFNVVDPQTVVQYLFTEEALIMTGILDILVGIALFLSR